MAGRTRTGIASRITSYNVCYTKLLRRRKELSTLYKLESIDEEHYEIPEPAEVEDADLIEMVNQLPVGYKAVFLLHVVDGYSHREIADVLGISESTSRSQFFKARKFLPIANVGDGSRRTLGNH